MPRGRPRKNRKDMLVKSAEVIGWALGGLEREIAETKQRLATLTAQANKLRASIGARGRGAVSVASDQGSSAGSTRRRRRRMSAEARKRISDMMKKRWAERKKASK